MQYILHEQLYIMFGTLVLVWAGCYNRTLQAGELQNSRHFSVTLSAAVMSEVKEPVDLLSGESPL